MFWGVACRVEGNGREEGGSWEVPDAGLHRGGDGCHRNVARKSEMWGKEDESEGVGERRGKTHTHTHTCTHTHSGRPMARLAKMRRAHAMDRKDGITHVLALPVFSVVSFHSFSIFLFLLYYSFSFMVLTRLASALTIVMFLSICQSFVIFFF